MTYRGVEVLRAVDLILAEDTRTSRVLLQHYGINPPQLIECGDPTSYYLLIQSGKGVSVNAVRENAIRGYDIRILQIEPQLQEKKDMLAIWNKNQSNPLIPSFLSISKALLNQQES